MIETDLGINRAFVKGQRLPVKNCWHFYTDGKSIDALFYDDNDFRSGMNRVFVLSREYDLRILAFVLMDTHVHFVLYGEYETCNRFMREFIRRTSLYIRSYHGERKKLRGLPMNYQKITDDLYLKTVICYTLKNPTAGGLPYLPQDYPWSSAYLYFRRVEPDSDKVLIRHNRQKEIKTHKLTGDMAVINTGMVSPAEYVAVDLVERIFRSHKSFYYFMGTTRDEDIESRSGTMSLLALPIQEMRQHRAELSQRLFGTSKLRILTVPQRLKLARLLKSKYNCSIKQISRVCGLVYEDVQGNI